jgi:zinc protease
LDHRTLEIQFEKYRLANGLQVILHEDRKLPVVHVNLWYHVGSKNEKPGRTGFAHLFEHMMFGGSKHADGEFLAYVEKAGANLREGGVNGTTSFDRTNYFETVPSESLEYILWLESDRMGFLTDVLTQQKLDNQRDVVKNERRQSYENVPYGRALPLIFENLFPKGHPYSWLVIGSQEDLDAASLEEVKSFFTTYYTPNNCSLVIAGDFEEGTVRHLVDNYLGPIPPGPTLERAKLWTPRMEGEKRIEVSDRVPQERLYLAWPTLPYFYPGDAELDLASRILSQGKNSRFYKALVYDRQIASDVSAFNYSLEISGVFGIIATVRPDHKSEEVLRVIDEELARFGETGPTEEELGRERAKQEFDFISGLERIGGFGGKGDLLNQYNTFLGSPDYFQRDYDRYQGVSIEGIRNMARRYLSTRNRLLVTFIPEVSGRPGIPETDRTRGPEIGPRRIFQAPEAKTALLENGLMVIVTPRPELPKVAVSLLVKSGGASDPKNKPGVAWMTAEMLDEGTQSKSALEIQGELDRLGTSLFTAAETEVSHVSLETLKKNLAPSMSLMAELILRPSFPSEEMERQRKRRLDAILQERHNPSVIARKVFRLALFGDSHPYGRDLAGSETSVSALTREDLEAYYHTFWKPNHAAAIYAGDVTLEEAVAETRKVLGEWVPGPVPLEEVPVTGALTQQRIYLVDRQDAPQSQIRVGSVGPKRTVEDYYAIETMNAVLGGAFASRLNLNLREDKGYTYGAFSSFSYGRHLGLWACGAGVQTRFSKEALLEFVHELDAICHSRPITPAELEAAKANLTRGFAQRFETLGRMVDQIADMVSHGLPLEEIASYAAAIETVTLNQAQSAARKYLDVSKAIIVIVGDVMAIEPEIRRLDLGEVTLVDPEGKPL